eukprot:5712787-Alexandrium_andersonii.AAC.1
MRWARRQMDCASMGCCRAGRPPGSTGRQRPRCTFQPCTPPFYEGAAAQRAGAALRGQEARRGPDIATP